MEQGWMEQGGNEVGVSGLGRDGIGGADADGILRPFLGLMYLCELAPVILLAEIRIDPLQMLELTPVARGPPVSKRGCIVLLISVVLN